MRNDPPCPGIAEAREDGRVTPGHRSDDRYCSLFVCSCLVSVRGGRRRTQVYEGKGKMAAGAESGRQDRQSGSGCKSEYHWPGAVCRHATQGTFTSRPSAINTRNSSKHPPFWQWMSRKHPERWYGSGWIASRDTRRSVIQEQRRTQHGTTTTEHLPPKATM